MQKTNFEKVKEFMDSMGQHRSNTLNYDGLQKGISLIKEEYAELIESVEAPNFFSNAEWVHTSKELADLLYVCYWTGAKMGVDMDAVFAEVHNSNMSKLDPKTGKPIYREDGKVLKGSNYHPPLLAPIIFK